jgi:hypothetical protein
VGGCQQAVEQFQPVGLMLRVGQCLGLDGSANSMKQLSARR